MRAPSLEDQKLNQKYYARQLQVIDKIWGRFDHSNDNRSSQAAMLAAQ